MRGFRIVAVELDALALLEDGPAAHLRAWLAVEIARARDAAEARYGPLDRATFVLERDREVAGRLADVLARAARAGVSVPGPTAEELARRARARADHEAWARAFVEDILRERERMQRAACASGEAAERAALARELGVDLDGPAEQVKRQVRALALRVHPDHGGDSAAMVRLNRLRELLATQMGSDMLDRAA
jgi:hypothetical protein